MDKEQLISLIYDKIKGKYIILPLEEIDISTVKSLFSIFEDPELWMKLKDETIIHKEIVYPLVKEILRDPSLRKIYLQKLLKNSVEYPSYSEIYHFIIFLRYTNESEINTILKDKKELFFEVYLKFGEFSNYNKYLSKKFKVKKRCVSSAK